jgi:hypothetical protein
MGAQMVKRRLVFLMCEYEEMMHASMVFEHRVDRSVALHQDEARPGCIKKGHVPIQRGGQVPGHGGRFI